MLVLSRHRDESIVIGDDIVITVIGIRGDKVRLGISAPRQLTVHRHEIYEQVLRERGELPPAPAAAAPAEQSDNIAAGPPAA